MNKKLVVVSVMSVTLVLAVLDVLAAQYVLIAVSEPIARFLGPMDWLQMIFEALFAPIVTLVDPKAGLPVVLGVFVILMLLSWLAEAVSFCYDKVARFKNGTWIGF